MDMTYLISSMAMNSSYFSWIFWKNTQLHGKLGFLTSQCPLAFRDIIFNTGDGVSSHNGKYPNEIPTSHLGKPNINSSLHFRPRFTLIQLGCTRCWPKFWLPATNKGVLDIVLGSCPLSSLQPYLKALVSEVIRQTSLLGYYLPLWVTLSNIRAESIGWFIS